MSGRDNNKKAWAWAISFALIAVIVGITTWLLSYKTERYYSSGEVGSDTSSLECSASHPTEPFFISNNVQTIEHKLKLVFKGGAVSDISYVLEGTYNNASVAETSMAEMHAQYNKFMSKYSVYAENYNPVFTSVNTKARVSLYAEKAKLNRTIAKVLFIDDTLFDKINDSQPEDFKKNYEDRGFYCTYSK